MVEKVFELRSTAFRREREQSWKELEALVEKVKKGGLAALGARETARLPVLYQSALSSLSVARSISLDRALLAYLESLCSRTYLVIYGTRRHAMELALEFIRNGFPVAVQRIRFALVLSAAVLLLGTLTGFLMTTQDPTNFNAFVDEALAGDRGPQASRDELRATLYDDSGRGAGELAVFSAFLFNNNSGVGILAFSLGIIVGLPSLILVFNNGLMLGAFAALFHSRDSVLNSGPGCCLMV